MTTSPYPCPHAIKCTDGVVVHPDCSLTGRGCVCSEWENGYRSITVSMRHQSCPGFILHDNVNARVQCKICGQFTDDFTTCDSCRDSCCAKHLGIHNECPMCGQEHTRKENF